MPSIYKIQPDASSVEKINLNFESPIVGVSWLLQQKIPHEVSSYPRGCGCISLPLQSTALPEFSGFDLVEIFHLYVMFLSSIIDHENGWLLIVVEVYVLPFLSFEKASGSSCRIPACRTTSKLHMSNSTCHPAMLPGVLVVIYNQAQTSCSVASLKHHGLRFRCIDITADTIDRHSFYVAFINYCVLVSGLDKKPIDWDLLSICIYSKEHQTCRPH